MNFTRTSKSTTTPLPAPLLQVEIEPGCWLSSERSLYLASEQTLVIADIHWGYADSHRRAGNLLPRWGDAELANRLRALLGFYAPRLTIWLGDSLHTADAAPIAEEFLSGAALPPTIVLRGNHDRKWWRIDGEHHLLGRYFFHHGDKPIEIAPEHTEVIGHLHPAISLGDGAGLRLKMPALVQSARRLILPSFSHWAAGSPWNGELAADEKLWVITPKRIWPIGRTR